MNEVRELKRKSEIKAPSYDWYIYIFFYVEKRKEKKTYENLKIVTMSKKNNRPNMYPGLKTYTSVKSVGWVYVKDG